MGVRSGTTYDTYSVYLRNVVVPEIRNLRLDECTVGRLEDLMDTLQAEDMSADARRSVRTVLSGIFGLAVRRDLISANPVRQMSPIEGGARRKARAMTADEMHDFLAKLDADKIATRYDLPDFVRFMLGQACVSAKRWPFAGVISTWLSARSTSTGTSCRSKARDLCGNGGKSFSAQRTAHSASSRCLGSSYLHTLLTVRRPPGARDDEPVFPAGTLTSDGKLTWKWPGNTGKSIRRLRQRIEYQWVTSHVFRKTVATLQVPAAGVWVYCSYCGVQLGEIDPHWVWRPDLPIVAEVVDRLGEFPATGLRSLRDRWGTADWWGRLAEQAPDVVHGWDIVDMREWAARLPALADGDRLAHTDLQGDQF
ncbi:hypothetical protein ACWDKQ_33800 [Saccharopolyspora sp. NPDC000995]